MIYSILRLLIFMTYGFMSSHWFGWEISDVKYWAMLGLLMFVQLFTAFEAGSKK